MTGQSPIKLRPRARLMKTLGEELISNEQVALIELVKNAYDADAGVVLIRFIGPLAEGTGAVEVWDNGHGMSAETVRTAWMEISTPYRHKSPRSESNQRRVLGAKGIGRFAAARLGYQTEVVTRRAESEEIAFAIDWSAFDDEDTYLDDVAITWQSRTPEVFTLGGPATATFAEVASGDDGSGTAPVVDHGTVVRLARFRRGWDKDDIQKVRRALSRLIPPPQPEGLDVLAQPSFSIWLDASDSFPELSGPVGGSEVLAHPDYQIVGTVAPDGAAHLTYTEQENGRAETIEVNLRETSPPGTKPFGPLQLDVRVWNLEAGSIRRLLTMETAAKNISEIRSLIRENAGIALYRDGFRVQPYGEPGNDWLQLDPRRVNNPGLRLSNNQVAGFVYITADDNPELRDRSHREGLIDTPEYDGLKAVLIGAINEIEQRRWAARRKNRESDSRERVRGLFDAFDLGGLRKAITAKYPHDRELNEALDEAEDYIQDGVRQVQEVVSRFSRLASLGTLVDVILHDGRGALNRIAFALRKLDKAIKQSAGTDQDLVSEASSASAALEHQREALDLLFKRIEPLSGRRRGRPQRLSLHKVLEQAVEIMGYEAAVADTSMTVGGVDQTITADPADLLQIAVNLTQNSIYWLSTARKDIERQVVITTSRIDDGAVAIDFSDNGPGVRASDADLIFDPYYSTKPDGIGLGLSIAGSIVKDFYDGELVLLAPATTPGATFRVILRRRIG